MPSMNLSDESPGVENETFHIYILSFAYGLLVVLIVVHLIWRWQWRRKELSHLKPHTPGDKSFYCKSMKNRLRADFSVIQQVHSSPKARLVNPKYSPSQFGSLSDGLSVPSHWYRMKVFDAAANFVSQNAYLVECKGSGVGLQDFSTMFLPAFVSLLRDSGLLHSGGDSDDTCCELYNWARYKDGVFKESQWEEFRSLLTQLRAQLHGDQSESVSIGTHTRATGSTSLVSPSSEIMVGYGQHDPLQQTTSNDPLIGFGGEEPTFTPQPSQATELTKDTPGTASSSATPSRLRGKKPTTVEMSPLIKDSDSEVGTPQFGSESTV